MFYIVVQCMAGGVSFPKAKLVFMYHPLGSKETIAYRASYKLTFLEFSRIQAELILVYNCSAMRYCVALRIQ